MIVIIDNIKYKVRFLHENNTVSTCTIEDDEEKIISHAECYTHPKDNFSKEKGRKLSLQRALDCGVFNKVEKSVFWENYRNWGKTRW